MMRSVLLPVLLFVIGCNSAEPQPQPEAAVPAPGPTSTNAASSMFVSDFSEFETRARATTNKLQLQLKQELSSAMSEHGAAGAVEVCSERASTLTAEVGELNEISLRRVSLRNRNPENRASVGEASLLALMAARPDLADTLVVRDGVPVYMRAIRITTPMCLQCHGARDDLDPDVARVLDATYPDDMATGFSDGDLRGAFVARPAAN